jgi:hypothetical protein
MQSWWRLIRNESVNQKTQIHHARSCKRNGSMWNLSAENFIHIYFERKYKEPVPCLMKTVLMSWVYKCATLWRDCRITTTTTTTTTTVFFGPPSVYTRQVSMMSSEWPQSCRVKKWQELHVVDVHLTSSIVILFLVCMAPYAWPFLYLWAPRYPKALQIAWAAVMLK